MPPRKSNNTAPVKAATKPHAKRSAICEEAEPTPTQKKRQERQEKLNAAKKRQARYMETPTKLEGNGFLAKTTLFTRELTAYPSHDDIPNKRRRVDHRPKTKKLARHAPCDKDSKFKKPFLHPGPPVGASPRDEDPVTAVCRLGNLPVEIRDEILRYLLLWPHEIMVFDGWSRVFPRCRPRLNLSILYTCQVLREQGLRILFGENKFTYDSKDPAACHGHTNPVLDKVFANSVVPINEYGHLIRHVKIKVHRSRLHFSQHRRTFEDALLKFIPGGGLAHAVNLHTLTLEIPAETKSDLGWLSITGKPTDVPICEYLQEGSRLFKALFQLQIQWVHVLAWDTHGECWRTEVDMRYFAKDEQMRLEHIALGKGQKHSKVDSANNQAIPRDAAEAACYRTKDVEAMEELWDRRVNRAVGKLRNLAWRIQGLAVNPELAVKLKLWRPVKDPTDGGSKNHASSELASLPPNFREPSYSVNTRSSRGQVASGRSNPDVTRMATQSKSNLEATTGTLTGTSLSHRGIFNAKNTVKETRLLQAQQDVQMNEVGRGDKAILTEKWLENVSPHDPDDI